MITAKVIATCFALTGFAATAIAGVYVGNPATLTLVRALVVMGGAWAVGLLVGTLMQKTIERHVEQYKQQHPLPDVEAVDAGEDTSEASASDRSASAGAAGPSMSSA